MKNPSACFLSAFSLFIAASAAHPITISVNATSPTATVGSSVSVGIAISDLVDSAAPSLGAYDLDLGFNPAVLTFTGAAFGDPVLGNQLDLFGLGNVNAATPSASSVNLFEISLDLPDDLNDLQAGSFTLATFSFQAIAPGMSLLDLTINALGDALGDPLTALISGGSVTVQQASVVPEPSTLALVCLILVPMAWAQYRARRQGAFKRGCHAHAVSARG